MNFAIRSKKSILFSFIILMLFSCKTKEENVKKSAKQPNIIYIMSDDHTTQAFGIYGSRLASLNPTPTLDKIAK